MAFKVLGSAVIDENENIVGGSATFAGPFKLGEWANDSASAIYMANQANSGQIVVKGGGSSDQSAFSVYSGGWSGVTNEVASINADGSSEFFKTLLKTPTGTANSTNLLTVSDSSSNVNFTVKGTGATNIFGPLVVDRNAGGDSDTGSVVVQSGGTVKTRLNDDGSATFAGLITANGNILSNRTGSTQTVFQGTLSGATKVNITAGGSATFTGTVDAGALTIGGSSVDTSAQVDAKIAALVDGAPTALNTLNELAAALNDQSDYASSITSILSTKANSSSLATVATSGSYTDLSNKPSIPTHTSHLTNNSGFITSADGGNAQKLDNLDSSQFLRSDANDTLGGVLSYHSNDARLQFRNSSYNTYLYIGGWSNTNSNNISRIRNSSGNLHIDSAANGHLYLNNYSSGDVYANGANKVWHAGNDGAGSGLDADHLDGYTWMSSGKDIRATNLYVDDWIRHYNDGEGLYNEATGIHWHADGDGYWTARDGSNHIGIKLKTNGSSTRGYVYATNSNEVGFLDSDGNWAVRCLRDSYVELRDNNEATFRAGQSGVDGDYGTVCTHGTGKNNWEGYSINGRYVFMSADSNQCGIFNDIDNEWILYAARNSYTSLYHNGGECFRTTGTTSAEIGGSTILHSVGSGLSKSGSTVSLNIEGLSSLPA